MKELTIGIFTKKNTYIHNARMVILHDPIVLDYDALSLEPQGVLIYYPDNFIYSVKDGKIEFKVK